VKNLAEMHFPQAFSIIDLYHAREHVSTLCRLLFRSDEKRMKRYRDRWWTELDAGKIEKIIFQADRILLQELEQNKKARDEIRYLAKNKTRMQYAEFRAKGLFVGSGVVEAGCRTMIGQRLKQSGMEWTQRGANVIIALRCVMKSNRLEDDWESRAA